VKTFPQLSSAQLDGFVWIFTIMVEAINFPSTKSSEDILVRPIRLFISFHTSSVQFRGHFMPVASKHHFMLEITENLL
jgi:hypothetical protein